VKGRVGDFAQYFSTSEIGFVYKGWDDVKDPFKQGRGDGNATENS
jgi:hypothetical protein